MSGEADELPTARMSRKMSDASTPEARDAVAADDPDTTLLLTVMPPIIWFMEAANQKCYMMFC